MAGNSIKCESCKYVNRENGQCGKQVPKAICLHYHRLLYHYQFNDKKMKRK